MTPRLLAIFALVLLTACAREIGGAPTGALRDGGMDGGLGSADAGPDGGRFGNSTSRPGQGIPDAAFEDPNATTNNPDAFFINDPLPPYCGPEGSAPDAGTIEGTVSCPSDKNREGCPCTELGERAACWPGQRIHRNHGICQDGQTECVDSGEFGLRWGPCEGYVLPVEGAASGPQACGCFSSGTWSLSNLSPCIYRGQQTWLYSSTLNADGSLNCGVIGTEPPEPPDDVWSRSTLDIDCAGEFRLCFTIKAGDVDDPKPSDCVLAQTCTDVWYPEAGVPQALPDLPAWVSDDNACATQFDRSGGYGEMSVLGQSVECDEVDDGDGNPYVFYRTNYCAPSCAQTPTAPECIDCRTGGSGDF